MKELLAAAASIATLGSAFIYGLLALGYSEFYRELGVTPRDVGIEVSKTLGDAVGVAILLTVASLLLALLMYTVWRLVRRDKPEPPWLVAHGRLNQFTALFVAAALLWFLAAATLLRFLANTRADDVKEGRPVEPLRIGPGPLDFFPLEVLAVRADPVFAIASLRADDSVPPELEDAQETGSLFYLGRSAGSAVLYDADTQRSFVVPATSLVFELSNCETKYNTDRACG